MGLSCQLRAGPAATLPDSTGPRALAPTRCTLGTALLAPPCEVRKGIPRHIGIVSFSEMQHSLGWDAAAAAQRCTAIWDRAWSHMSPNEATGGIQSSQNELESGQS